MTTIRFSQLLRLSVVLLLPILALAAETPPESKPIDVGDRPQLFIDNLFFESSENITLHMNPPTKTGEQTLVSDRPWENATLNWFSVMEDDGSRGPGGKYRMWYECYDVEGWPTTNDTSFCYAESADAIHWNKPALAILPYHDSTENNILFRQIGSEGAHSRVHGAGVFKDPNAPPETQYKAVSQGMFTAYNPVYRVAGMTSPDGLHWTRLAKPICDVFADSQYSGFWDTPTRQYVLYGRSNGHGRAIGRATSASFDQFAPLELVLETNDQDPPESDLYNPAAIKYPYADHAYFMFPSLYRHKDDTLDIHLAVSRDGIHWTWPERGKPFVALGPAGTFDSGSLYMGQGLIRANNELNLYYSGAPIKHNESELDALSKPENKRIFGRLVSRPEGLVSAEAGEQEAIFTTPPLKYQGNRLLLNAKTAPNGEIRIALLNAEGKPIPGYTIQDSTPITGDHQQIQATWKRNPTLPEPTQKLTIKMKNASLYSFQFSN